MSQNETQKIPVVFVTPTRFGIVNNGPAIYARYLWESFSNHTEIDFHLVTPQSNVEHERIHVSGSFKNSRRQYGELQSLAMQVASACRGKSKAIVHGNTAHTMWLFKKYDGPVIAQVNDYDAANVYDNPMRTLMDYGARRLASLVWRNLQERKAMRFLTRVVCNSRYTRQQVLRQYKIVPPEKATVIYKAVDLEPFKQSLAVGSKFESGLLGKRKVLFVGCNWHRKGLDNLITAVSLLDKEFADVSLIVAGAQSQKADHRIRLLPEKLGISDRVQFLGRVDRSDLIGLYKNVDLAALPSRQEALGVAILESLAAGLPVVATKVGGITEILENCQSSALVEPENPRQIAAAIQSILLNKNSGTFTENVDVATQFKKETMVQELKTLYSELATSP